MWVILSVVGTVVDAAAVAKMSKQLVSAGRTLNETGDLVKTREAIKAAGLDAGTEEKVMQALEQEAKKIKQSLDEKKAAEKAAREKTQAKTVETEKAPAEKSAHAKNAEVIFAEVDVIAGKKVWTGNKANAFLDKHGANAMYLPGETGKPVLWL